VAGNAATQATKSVTVDTTAPTPTFTFANDSGASATDKITKYGTINVVLADDVYSWQYSVNGGSTWANGSGTSFVLNEGTYSIDTVKVKQTDMSGNISNAGSNAISYIVDLTAPILSISGIVDDSGRSNTDFITNDNKLIFNGTAASGLIVSLKLNGSTIGTTTATSLNVWTFDYTSTSLADGSYTLLAESTDLAGNTGSTDQLIIVDTLGPSQAITAVSGDNRILSTNFLTTSNQLIISGTADSGSSISVSIDGANVGNTTSALGAWSVDDRSQTLSDGIHILSLTATDEAGNSNASSQTLYIKNTGIPLTSEANLKAILAGAALIDTDANGIPDVAQNAAATLAWINVDNFLAAVAYTDNTKTPPPSNSLITFKVMNNSLIDTNADITNITVLPSDPSDSAMTGYIVRPSNNLVTNTTISTSWDPLLFQVEALNGLALRDIDSSLAGTQIKLMIDISNTHTPVSTFNSYMKYISADTIHSYIIAGLNLITLDGEHLTSLSQAGWYDFTQRTTSGNGARFITSDGYITGIEITITDNVFGDDNPTTNIIVDPGVPVSSSDFSPLSGGTSEEYFNPIPMNPKYETPFQWQATKYKSERESFNKLLFIDPDKNFISALVYEKITDADHLNYLDVLTNKISNQELDQLSIDQSIEKTLWGKGLKTKNDWDLIFKTFDSDFKSHGRLSSDRILLIESTDHKPIPTWLKIDKQGFVYISQKFQGKKYVKLKVLVHDKQGIEKTFEVEINSTGIIDIKSDNFDAAYKNIVDKFKTQQFVFNNPTKIMSQDYFKNNISQTKENSSSKLGFGEQIKSAKDDLYSLNVVH
jgi:hypothetical protein